MPKMESGNPKMGSRYLPKELRCRDYAATNAIK